jgi:potassium/chloride transporter 4/5/6
MAAENPRFAVSDVSQDEIDREDTTDPGADSKVENKGLETPDMGPNMQYLSLTNEERNQYTTTSITSNLALYEEELQKRPKISSLLSNLVNYDPVQPNTMTKRSKKKKKKANLGTIMGVYLPTLQNILGVILFLRLPWIVGIAGVGQAFLLVGLCCVTTFLTAISLSAIATNGHVPAGGSYFMISRNLGPEFGGAVGILFYLATTFASSLYVVGAIEILLTYVVPQISLFGEVAGNPDALFNNIRVYGTILLLLMAVIVFIGVKIVNWFASLCLVAVLIAVVSIYAGALNPVPRENLCTVDGVLLRSLGPDPFSCDSGDIARASDLLTSGDEANQTSSLCFFGNPRLQKLFNGTFFSPLGEGVEVDNVTMWTTPPRCLTGIPGITRTRTIVDNTEAGYLEEGEVRPGQRAVGNMVQAEITTTFFVLIGIFFPSVTGIMAGSNRSGDLKDAQKSIPIGTLAAIITTSLIYLSCVLFFGATIQTFLLRDQYGSASGLTVALLAWPSPWVILIGALLSTIGAGLQSLTGAPRLMQAISNDNLIGFLRFFKRTGLNGEPSYALLLTVVLSELGVLIASLDLVAPILTMFFLMCYMFVNFACTLQSFLKAPNWRPRFRYYHWSTSLLGGLLCLTIMFIVSWYYALAALLVAIVIYKYIEYRGAEKEWGDGVSGLSLQAARYSLLKLEEAPPHTKNWRPQLLILCKLDQNLIPDHPKVLSLASQLKAGKGLLMVFSILEDHYNTERAAEALAAQRSLKLRLEDNNIKGFCRVIASPSVSQGLSDVMQTAGLGGMKHNTILLGWPDSWRKKPSWRNFVETIRVASVMELAVLVPKGINWYPSNEDRMKGHIDIWWVVHDGGLLMLLPFLLRQHKVWKHCYLRIFTVAQLEDNSIQMKRDLATFLYQLRIPAEVNVIEMPDTDISAYTYERTLIMEQRNEMLQRMRMTEKQKRGDVQHLLARSFSSRQMSIPAIPPTPSSPPGEISIPVPQLRRVHFDHPPHPSTAAALALSDVTVETNNGNLIPMTTIREEVGVVEGQCGALCTGSENGLNCMVVNSVFSGKGVNSGVCYLRWREWCTPGVVATETSS